MSHFKALAGKGKGEGEMAVNICKLLFTREVASHLNWIGTERKKGLKTMRTGQLIIGMDLKKYVNNDSNI